MEFIERMQLTEDSKNYENHRPFSEELTLQSFHHIKFYNVSLSVQASYAMYCTPRKTLKNLREYSNMEFALMDENNFLKVSEVLPDFSKLKEIEDFEGGGVYCYVPIALIEELYQALKKKDLEWTFGS